MQCNIGKTDKTIRIIVGILIILWGFFDKNWWGLIGLIPLLTGIVSWCPVYSLLGIKTCEHKSGSAEDTLPSEAGNHQDQTEREAGEQSQSSQGESDAGDSEQSQTDADYNSEPEKTE